MCRDHKGKVVSGITSQIYAPSAFIAESLTLRKAISLVVSLELSSIVVESDCKDLEETCRGNIRRREIDHILKDIFSMKDKFT